MFNQSQKYSKSYGMKQIRYELICLVSFLFFFFLFFFFVFFLFCFVLAKTVQVAAVVVPIVVGLVLFTIIVFVINCTVIRRSAGPPPGTSTTSAELPLQSLTQSAEASAPGTAQPL